MKKFAKFVPVWISNVGLLLLTTILLASCGNPPQKPILFPDGTVSVDAGKQLVVKVEAQDAVEYKWTLSGDGTIPPSTTADTILYTAPAQGNTAILSVVASNKNGDSPSASLVINIVHHNGILLPLNDVNLLSDSRNCSYSSNAESGKIDPQGNLTLSGLEAGKDYMLTLNGKPNTELNKLLCDIQCSGTEGYWDFQPVTAGPDGSIRQTLTVNLPPTLSLPASDTFDAKFFIKDIKNSYCIVLGANNFSFKVGVP